jgi:hypothetical protein
MNSTYINNKNRTTVYEENEFTKSLHMLFLIRNELESSKVGIENLQKTYEMDINVISQLEVVVNKIDSHLKIVDRKLRDIHGGSLPTDLQEKTISTEQKSVLNITGTTNVDAIVGSSSKSKRN